MNDAPILDLTGISKAYNIGKPAEVSVLRGVDLQVQAGEVVALVAPSGAGKSTLLHIAGLLDTPDAGQVRIGGTDMTGLPDRRRTLARRGGHWICLSVSPFAAGIQRTGKHPAAATRCRDVAQRCPSACN